MARTELTVQALSGSYPSAGSTLTYAAGDVANGNAFKMGGKELLLARNVSADTDYYITIDSVANALGRQADITEEDIAFGTTRVYGPFTDLKGWRQSDGMLYINVENADIELAVVTVL